jgi:hypothetical protein
MKKDAVIYTAGMPAEFVSLIVPKEFPSTPSCGSVITLMLRGGRGRPSRNMRRSLETTLNPAEIVRVFVKKPALIMFLYKECCSWLMNPYR